jgi:hypothetical protein
MAASLGEISKLLAGLESKENQNEGEIYIIDMLKNFFTDTNLVKKKALKSVQLIVSVFSNKRGDHGGLVKLLTESLFDIYVCKLI